jgi:hypothetical protein
MKEGQEDFSSWPIMKTGKFTFLEVGRGAQYRDYAIRLASL